MAAVTFVGLAGMGSLMPAVPAFADDYNGDNGDRVSTQVEVERNNEIDQEIDQDQEACTNEAHASVNDDDFIDIGGDNTASVDQSNTCIVLQDQTATQGAAIIDFSTNDIDVEAISALVDLEEIFFS